MAGRYRTPITKSYFGLKAPKISGQTIATAFPSDALIAISLVEREKSSASSSVSFDTFGYKRDLRYRVSVFMTRVFGHEEFEISSVKRRHF